MRAVAAQSRREEDELRAQLAVLGERKSDRQEVSDLRQKTVQWLEEKVDVQEVQSALNASVQDTGERLAQLREDFKLLLRQIEQDLLQQVAKRATSEHVASALQQQR